MTREQTVESIQKAKKYHELQMQKIEALVYGKDITDPTAVSKRECNFGKWLYEDESHLKAVLGAQFYEKIEMLHGKWHEQYYKIYEIFFTKPAKKGLIAKVFNQNKVSPLDMDKAKLYYAELKENTENLFQAILACERRVMALSESKFQNLSH